ncbi:cytochrome d ubiquinol oxidase subunit II [Mitsuaria sp. GD03876]|uniref:cytochrome d ubiquinol oxidase subunit II n=1 Tax=Mitsuaria sp. GD03876 TaxID=2975399 RepID=UPI002447AC43|nr:cytochrome d ubiquinol oxidase subunit II [Mitsuaria sp. GD03876]MDH0863466.1 cytochrome d ubiquinol oxidase subunit II [Mitsuaria sp. GD03876]
MNALATMNAGEGGALPVIFMALMGLALLIYVVLDGYDLGVGMLSASATEADRDRMIASIGPFWDANETWLVLAVGLLLIAFPKAQGVVLTALYVPVVLMLLGLILRGAAFDFRAKGDPAHKRWWDAAFAGGSAMASLTQGWMLGRYVTGFEDGAAAQVFAAGIAVALTACYALLGAGWLLIKTEDDLQRRAVTWAKRAWPAVVAGLVVVSIASPWLSPTVRARWFDMPGLIALAPLPLVALLAMAALRGLLNSHRVLGKLSWAPFALMVVVLTLSFFGLSYSLYPFVVIDRLTLWEAAAADESLRFMLVGAVVTMPVILAYSLFSYRVFKGKVRALAY